MIMYPVNAVADYMVTLIACMRICVTPVSIYPPNPAKLDQGTVTICNPKTLTKHG